MKDTSRGWAARSEFVPSAVSAVAYLAAAVSLAVLAGTSRGVGFVDVLLILGFALLTRLEYAVGAGSAVPAQLAFVPMLFLMPLRLVPLAVFAGSLIGTGIAAGRGRRPTLCPNAVGACWFALPPVLLLLVAGEQPFAWSRWPLYVAVFASQSLIDLVHTAVYEWFAHRVAPRQLVGVLGTVYGMDALLTPIAMLAARDGGYSFLALLPFTGVLYLLGHERRSRLDAQSEADRLEALAHVDDLTRVANRRSFDRRLVVEEAQALRTGGSFSICLLDLDFFKPYNDRFGHPAGDDLLRRASEAWKTALRPGDLLARIGGEEFGLILPNSSADEAEVVVDRLRAVTPREITFSAGLACWSSGESLAELIGRADAALYRAKDEGRDRLVLAA